jgi:hypothetical protein
MMLEWILALLAVAAIVGIAARLARRDRRHPAGTPAEGRHPPHARPADPLHKHATHYLASGALPRWDP